jgi:hypothetical protein
LTQISHTVTRRLPSVSVERVFDVVVAEDVLPKVLHRYGPIPGVRGTADNTGPWDTPGSSRTVLLEDGSTAREQVLAWERPRRFEYRVDRLSNPLGRLVDHAVGSWAFAENARGSEFTWMYAFVPAARPAAPVLRAFVALAWARYMNGCADRCVELARSDA